MDGLLDRAIEETIHSKMLELHTMLPATVVAFYAEEQTVDVQIELQRNYNGEPEAISILKDVPIIYPRAGGYILTFPIKEGDPCKLDFCERSLDKWLLEGGTVDPEDSRAHSLSDAVAYVGMWNRTNPIKDYNTEEPEFRSEDGIKKVWLSNDGWVEMVNLDLDTRVVLRDNGDVRVANDKVKASVEVFETTKVKMSNPLSKARLDPEGDILLKNPLISRQMDKLGNITDETLIARQVIEKTGKKLFKNAIAKQVTEASGKIDFRAMLNKFEMSPGGNSKLGNSLNKLTVDLVKSTLGNPVNKLNVGAVQSTLGNAVSKLRVLPTSAMLQDAAGVVTPALVTSMVSAITAIAGNLGLESVLGGITAELANITDLLDSAPEDPPEEEDIFDTVVEQMTVTLLENDVDLESEDAIIILDLSDSLDNSWDDEVFNNLLSQLESTLDG